VSVTIVRTGLGNTASLMAAFARLGVETVLTDDPAVVRSASRVVLPGVGAFGPAMATLRAKGLALAVEERVATGRPLLGICLGLQLLTRQSAEAPGVAGLGILDAEVVPFRGGVRTPHLGWNRVTPEATATMLGPGDACFANSYHLDRVPSGMSGAYSEHGGPFVAAVERGSLLGCQFHPELSGRYGADLLRAWVSRC
jgi:imidazole glycerol phosphate synthase glutamine amidotransferase subunit